MDAINMAVLVELKEYAQLYFSAIVELHTVEGKCNLKPGKYSAKELVDNLKAACGSYGLPTDEIFNEDIEISVETFNCKFPYRRIFAILAQWEAMSKAGKQKAVFEIGEVEEKSAKVLLNEKTECGAFKTKSVKLQRITGNWWMPRKVKKNQPTELYYELNGIIFMPGKQVWCDNPTDPETAKWCERYNDEAMSKLLLSFLGNDREQTQKITPYYAEIANKAKIAATPAETPRIPTETAAGNNVPADKEQSAQTTINAETRQYIISAYKTKENLTAKFSDAIGSTLMQLEEYRANKRKGGRMRKENIRRLEEQIKLLYAQLNEWSALFDASQSPEPPKRAECTTNTPKPRETARKEPKRTIPNMGTVAPNINAFFQAGRYGVIVSRSVSRSKVNIFHALCSTAYSPPIRGDCNMRLRARAKPPNRLPNTA